MTNMVSIITAIHLAALSQVESGDQDDAVGQAGEVSRYQFLPATMLHEQAINPDFRRMQVRGKWWLNEKWAWICAVGIWEKRVDTFRVVYRRDPSLEELYLCWHRPGRVLNPTAAEKARAERFANLVNEKAHPQPGAAVVERRKDNQNE